jgi:hypothetical protein
MADPAASSGLPGHFEKEWGEARQLIDKQDERIQDTRKMVFGLFSSLLTASSLFASKDVSAGRIWVGVHLSLLGLLVTGRFIEQQALLLQAAAASRAFVLELLTPVELTGTLSDRFRTGWAQRTTYIYIGLGLVSTFGAIVAGGVGAGERAAILGLTGLYAAYIFWLGQSDLTFARDGQDWSFSATSCREGEVISIMLTNLGDKPLLPADPPGELRRICNEHGEPVSGDVKPLHLHTAVLDVGKSLPKRRPCRWTWKAGEPGLWILRVHGEDSALIRRCVHVRPRERTQERDPSGGAYFL